MKNECYRLFRNYCSLSIDDVAGLTGISKKRLIGIEHGDIIPDADECCKIAKLYNVSPDKLNGTVKEIFESIVCEPNDASFYGSEAERNMVIEKVASLSEDERAIIMMYRSSEDKSEAYDRIISAITKNEE